MSAGKARSDSSSSGGEDDKGLKIASQPELDYELQELLLRDEFPVDEFSPRRAQVPWPVNQSINQPWAPTPYGRQKNVPLYSQYNRGKSIILPR